jgi:hypothetical protein
MDIFINETISIHKVPKNPSFNKMKIFSGQMKKMPKSLNHVEFHNLEQYSRF